MTDINRRTIHHRERGVVVNGTVIAEEPAKRGKRVSLTIRMDDGATMRTGREFVTFVDDRPAPTAEQAARMYNAYLAEEAVRLDMQFGHLDLPRRR